VALLVLLTVSLLVGSARTQQADDPRSHTAVGAAALAQLLQDQGVDVVRTDEVGEATRRSAGAVLMVANPDRLDAAQAQQLLSAGSPRLVLLRPGSAALRTFGLPATTVSAVGGTVSPGCRQPEAERAGDISLVRPRAGYRPSAGAELACYPTGTGFALLRLRIGSTLVDLVAGGLANDTLAEQGNASWATALLGAQPRVVWLMTPRAAVTTTKPPTLLPGWWQLAVVQGFLAVVVVGIWQGRRLGPILVEPLPVTVRASETVEGHGRLYYRIEARDRAAEALREATRTRLGRAFGHRGDPEGLSVAVANRTGVDVRSVHDLLQGRAPDTDDQLRDLARGLDQLEQEASRL
jgi:hypothetical protein